MVCCSQLSGQHINKDTGYKRDSFYVFYKVPMKDTSLIIKDFIYTFEVNKRSRKEFNKLMTFKGTTMFVSATEERFEGYISRELGLSTFKLIIRLRNIIYIVFVEQYQITKIISTA